MPVIDPKSLYQNSTALYFNLVDKFDSEVIEWLDEGNGKRREMLSRWLDMALQTTTKRAVEGAARDRKIEIDVEVNLDLLGKDVHARLKPEARAKTPIEKILYSLEYLAEEAGYEVDTHKVQFSMQLVVFEPETAAIPEGASTQMTLPPEPPVPPPPPKPALELKEGNSYANKGTIRSIEKMDNGTIAYKIVKSASKRVPAGTTGSCTVAEFLEWAKELILTTDPTPPPATGSDVEGPEPPQA